MKRVVSSALLLLLAACALAVPALADMASSIEASRIKGGLCVILGNGDQALAEQLASKGKFIVHWLIPDEKKCQAVRTSLLAKGVYGQITVEEWKAKTLPFEDNLVSLLLVLDPRMSTQQEQLRVLRPHGEMLVSSASGVKSTVKPKIPGTDEWTQWRHAADRNPVSQDTVVEVPRRIQWLSLQQAETQNMVTSSGRSFYLTGGDLLARDAFNGLPLWKLAVDGKCSPVVSGENLYVLARKGLVCLDAATGVEKGFLQEAGIPASLLLVQDSRDAQGMIVAVDDTSVRLLSTSTGKLIWKFTGANPRAVSVADGKLFVISGDPKVTTAPSALSALSMKDGTAVWERKDLDWARTCFRSCCGNGVVAFESGKFAVPRPWMEVLDKKEQNFAHFISAKDGTTIKDYQYTPAMRHDENVRVFFVGDKAAVHRKERDGKASSIVMFSDFDKEPETFPALPPSSHYFYCYPPVATAKFFIYGQMSFTDWQTHEHVANQITRGQCGYWSEGMIPANGLVYTYPKSCNCFSMLHGFCALAPAYKRKITETQEFIKGPAYGASITGAAKPGDWPVLRGDDYRTGSTLVQVPTTLRTLWTADLPQAVPDGPIGTDWKQYPYSAGVITPPVIAEGTVFVAQPHTHRVIALNAADGKQKWQFVANGRVDTPPTIYKGLCLFGCRMGWVYCVRASDGALVWKRRVAPADLRIMQCGQVESPWPVPGSILVTGGVAYFGAGIHPLADGGIRVFALDPRSGNIKWTKTVTDMGYEERGWHGRAGLEQDYFDLTVKDGDKIALSHWLFDPQTGANEFVWHNAYYRVGKDGAYMQRGTWSYGYPMNRPRMKRPLLVAKGSTVFGANKVWEKNATGLRLFRRDFKPGEEFDVIWNEQPNDTESRVGVYFPANRIAEKVTWASTYPGWIEAMVLAGSDLFLYAGNKLQVYSASDGKAVNEMDLPKPVWDGIAAAGGNLYVSTQEGKIICLGK